MEEVRQYLAHNLPLDRASKLYHLFFQVRNTKAIIFLSDYLIILMITQFSRLLLFQISVSVKSIIFSNKQLFTHLKLTK